ncbi:MAG TPA: sigma-70 family RNA polymerase sigma factor [Candidatus Limnocylindrales bacterium]|nr:sigma-70 family RNA polymerase sigma factor [Candidatus Limnocylindrales bacterium]
MDDTELARRLAHDLDGSFEALVRGHLDRCYAIALRMLGDPREAEEVAQDALVRAYRALERYEPDRIQALQVRGWLATIVANLSRNRLRGRRIEPKPLEPLVETGREPAAGPGTDPHALAARRTEQDRLARAVLALPERYRLPVVLRHVDELSYAELVEVLGRPEGTIKAQVHRGLAMLRTALSAAELEERIA